MRIVGPPLADAAAIIQDTLMAGMHKPEWPEDLDPRAEPDLSNLFREFVLDQQPKLRLSFGKECARYQWYVANQPEDAAHRGAMRRRHVAGHLFEALALWVLEHHLPAPWSLDTSWSQKTVRAHNLEGHTDGGLYYDGHPYALLDCKETKSYVFKHWKYGRFPDAKWGYPYQAANYLAAARNEGVEFRGFLWPVGILDDPYRYECGWADHTELLDYEHRAAVMFREAQQLRKPPPPCHADRDKSPCAVWHSKRAGRITKYCEFYDTCIQDNR